MRKTSETVEQEVIRLYLADETHFRAIGPAAGVSTATVGRILQRNGLNASKNPPISGKVKAMIRDLRARKMTQETIADRFDIDVRTVRKYGNG